MRCEQAAAALPGVADGTAALDLRQRRHVEQCLRCQAELAQYKRLLRTLRSLRHEVVEPTPGLLGEVLGALEQAGERQAVRSALSGRRAAYLGGIAAAATAAGAASAIVLVTSRSHRARRPA